MPRTPNPAYNILPFEIFIKLDIPPALAMHLYTVLRYIKYACVIGSSNKPEDLARTANWSATVVPYSRRQHCHVRYGSTWQLTILPELYHDPGMRKIADKKLVLNNRTPAPIYPRFTRLLYAIFLCAMTGKAARAGNCGEQSTLAFITLWQHAHPEIDSITLYTCRFEVSVDPYIHDHEYLIINNKWLLDPWAPNKNGHYQIMTLKAITQSHITIAQFLRYALNNINIVANSALIPYDAPVEFRTMLRVTRTPDTSSLSFESFPTELVNNTPQYVRSSRFTM